MIRTIVGYLTITLFFLVTIPILPVLHFIGKKNPQKKDEIYLVLGKFILRLILKIAGTKVEVRGRENIPEDTPVLYICNHRSIFDILINYINMKEPTGMIAKDELKKIPLLNLWMLNIGCLFLDRKDIKQGAKTIFTAIDYVKKGRSIMIYPEGTRSKIKGEMLPFHAGSFKIAFKSKCPIIPVTIYNSDEIYENHKPKLKPVKVVIDYGKPVVTADLDREEMVKMPEQIHGIIYNKYLELAEEGA